MRAGRLPEDHPLELQARAKLRAKSPAAAAKMEQTPTLPQPPLISSMEQVPQTPTLPQRPPVQSPRRQPKPERRWG